MDTPTPTTMPAPQTLPQPKKSRPAPIVRGIQLDQDDYDLINKLWIIPTVVQAADGSAIANGRYFLYKNGQLPRVQRLFLQKLLEKLVKQTEEESRNPYQFNRDKEQKK